MNTPTMSCFDGRSRCFVMGLAYVAFAGMLVMAMAVGRAAAPGGTPPAAPAAPAHAPATAPAPAAPPAPKAVGVALAAALEKGDAGTARSLFAPGDAAAGKWVDATIALSAALKKLDAAASARFAEAGAGVSQRQLHFLDAPKTLEQAQEKIDGDNASLILPGQLRPIMRLKRIDHAWRAVTASVAGDSDLSAQIALDKRLTRAAQRTAEELTAGVYPTAADAARVFASRVLEARLRF